MRALQSVFVAIALTIVTSAAAQERLGLVLMHGKQSAPAEHQPLADAVAAIGVPVERPEMCWSGGRIYDRPYIDCLRDVDAAIERLRRRGATAIVVAGHSLGANAALGYGARNEVTGVVALAPGHLPEMLASRPPIPEDLNRARALIAAGRDKDKIPFADFNGSLQITVMATPTTYLSFFAPDSPAVMPINASRLKAPLLVVAGSADPIQRGQDYIFSRAPPHPLNRYVVVRAGHFDTSAASSETVIAWLRALAAR